MHTSVTPDDPFAEPRAPFRVEADRHLDAASSPAPTRTDQSLQANAPPDDERVLTSLLLDQLRVDLAQPRRYLDPYRNNRMLSAPDAVLDALEADAARDNPEARAYLADVTELADNIERIGLQYPLKVLATSEPGRYTIIDGERRYWALRMLRRRNPHMSANVLCLLTSPADTTEALEAAQWSVNVQRSDLSWIEIADWVAEAYDRALRAVRDGAGPVSVQADADTPDESPALALVGDWLHERSGRRLAPRTLYRLRRISTNLATDVKRLASAHHVGQNALTRLASISTAERQMRSLRIELGLHPDAQHDADANPGGRPSALTRCNNLLDSALDAIGKLDERALGRVEPEQAAQLITHMLDAHEQLRERIRRLQRMLRATRAAAAQS
jgi:hypothetical protein